MANNKLKPIRIDEEFLSEFEQYIMNIAKGLRDDAGYSGAHHDGGAGSLEHNWVCYMAGINRAPFPVKTYMDDYIKSKDSEYDEYIRLKEKFEG